MDIRKWILRLLRQGKLTDDDRNEARREFERDRRDLRDDRDDRGRQFAKKGYLDPDQIEEARRIMRETKETEIAKVLLKMGMVSEREVLMARAQEMRIGFVDLDRVNVQADAISCVPRHIAKNHAVMPVKKEGTALWLAMSNDRNILALDDVKMACGCRVIPVLATASAIENAIDKHYDKASG